MELLTSQNVDESVVYLANLFNKEYGDPELSLEELKRQIEQYENVKVFLKKEDGKYVSMVGITLFNEIFEPKKKAYLSWVVTLPEYRGRGYSKELMLEAINYAKKEGCDKVFLECSFRESRKSAHAMYKKIGFDGDSCRFYKKYI